MSEYKKAQARVRDLVEKRRLLERRLVSSISTVDLCSVQFCSDCLPDPN